MIKMRLFLTTKNDWKEMKPDQDIVKYQGTADRTCLKAVAEE